MTFFYLLSGLSDVILLSDSKLMFSSESEISGSVSLGSLMQFTAMAIRKPIKVSRSLLYRYKKFVSGPDEETVMIR